MNLISKVYSKFDTLLNQDRLLLSKSIIDQYINFQTYFPVTGSTLNYNTIHCIINDIIINKRERILEFGGGLSTIILLKFAEINKIKLQLVTVDNDSSWLDILTNYLKKNDLISNVQLVEAPLREINSQFGKIKWYDTNILDRCLNKMVFDTIIVDGPLAVSKNDTYNRFQALPYAFDLLNKEKYSIYLDDTNRKGEKTIIRKWNKIVPGVFQKLNNSTSFYIEGDNFNSVL